MRAWPLFPIVACCVGGPAPQPPPPTAEPPPASAELAAPPTPDSPTTATPPPPVAPSDPPAPGVPSFVELVPGLQFAEVRLPLATRTANPKLRIVRLDPKHWTLSLRLAEVEGGGRTGEAWLEDLPFPSASINPSMFMEDGRGVGMLSSFGRGREHVAASQNSLIAFDPKDPADTPHHFYDLECDGAGAIELARARYHTLVQSIRMVGCGGGNTWMKQEKIWSSALIGEQHDGGLLFLHVRAPYRMADLIDMLLAMPLSIKRLHYGEGGPEATLCVRTPTYRGCWIGSWETGYFESDALTEAQNLPNVIVAVPRGPSAASLGEAPLPSR